MFTVVGVFVFLSLEFLLLSLLFLRKKGSALRRLFSAEEEAKTERAERPRRKRRPSPSLPFFGRLEAEALEAGLEISARDLLLVTVLVAGAAFCLLSLVGTLPVALGGSLVGLLAPRWYIGFLRGRRAERFGRQLEGALSLMSSVLRAGGSLLQAVKAVAAEFPDPLGGEFRRAEQAASLGLTAEQALESVRERVASPDFELVAAASRTQAEVGGNLADVFDRIAETLRERRALRDTLRAHTAQGRLSGTVISAVPFCILGLVRFMAPDYLAPFFASPVGQAMLVFCFGMIVTGWFVIRRIVDVRLE